MIKEWRNILMETVYPIIFMDSIQFKGRKDNTSLSKEEYMTIVVKIEEKRSSWCMDSNS